jgi:hypothetical protein
MGQKCKDVDCEEPIQGRVMTVARELVRCRLDLVRIQEVRWDKEALYEQRVMTIYMGTELINTNWEQEFYIKE